MQVDAPQTLVFQFRETFEGLTPNWITNGEPDSGIFGTIDPVDDERAFAEPFPGGKSIAQHVAHLAYSLELFLDRMQGNDPPAAWDTSFETSGLDWPALQARLRSAYDACVQKMAGHATMPIDQWPPLHIAGVAAMIGHNAYHLGALRQLVKLAR